MDNQGSIFIANNNQLNDKTKHIQVKYLFVQETVERRQVTPQYIPGKQNPADLLTKPVSAMQFNLLLPLFGVFALANCVSSSPIRHQVNYHLVLNYRNPCMDIFDISYPKPSYPYGFEYYREHVTKECSRQYETKWLAAVQSLNNCPNQRSKRSIALELMTIAGRAVTNLLDTKFRHDNNNWQCQISSITSILTRCMGKPRHHTYRFVAMQQNITTIFPPWNPLSFQNSYGRWQRPTERF